MMGAAVADVVGVSVLRRIPPLGWWGIAVAAAVAFMTWHRYAADDTDADWTTPAGLQPAEQIGFPCSAGRPMEVGGAFRQRRYPGSLQDSGFSIIGDC